MDQKVTTGEIQQSSLPLVIPPIEGKVLLELRCPAETKCSIGIELESGAGGEETKCSLEVNVSTET